VNILCYCKDFISLINSHLGTLTHQRIEKDFKKIFCLYRSIITSLTLIKQSAIFGIPPVNVNQHSNPPVNWEDSIMLKMAKHMITM